MLAAAALSPDSIVNELEYATCYRARASFTVSMPQLEDDVTYTVALEQQSNPVADSLQTPDYLIDWRIDGHDSADGFAANFAGNHFRFSGERLQEYHLSDDPEPFRSHGRVQGVQRTAQFAGLLPAMLASEIRQQLADTACRVTMNPDTIISGRHLVGLHSVMILGGSVAKEAEYTFDPATLMPVRINIENNPGSISEQTVTVRYEDTGLSSCTPLSEERLMRAYPDVFERMRQNTFRIDNLPGSPLPAFALPTTTGERYSRRSGDPFRCPTIVAIIDAEASFTPSLITKIRDAVDILPSQTDVIWAFTGRHIDTIEEAAGGIRPGEHLLIGAGALARDCGVTTPPVLIIVRPDGSVADVIVGFNNDIDSDVIQKMALIRQ